MKLIRVMISALMFGLPLSATAQEPQPYNLQDFIRNDRFLRVSVSPKGTYAAATVPLEDKTVLVIIKPGQKEPYGHVNFKEPNTHVVDFVWVNDERILFTVGEKAGGLEQPVGYGEIWGTNADGSKQGIVAGARVANSAHRAGGRARAELASMWVVDSLRNDDDYVLVGVAPYASGEAPYTSVERMNVYTGTKQPVGRAPAKAASFLTDQQGRVRFAVGVNRDYKSVLYYRTDDKSEWRLLNDESVSGKVVSALDFNADDTVAYLQSEEKSGPDSIQTFDVVTGDRKQIARDDNVDPAGLIYGIGKRYPIGVAYNDAKPRFEYFEPASADARLHKTLQTSFGGATVTSGSFTDDGKTSLIVAHDDRNPGDIYLFDTKSKKADLLMSAAEWLDPARMAKTTPLSFSARDGVKLEALLTVPAGSSSGKRLPLIVYPHGGPFGVQDVWGYGRDVQILANHGYAVLQVNFRGSGGYGKDFMMMGYKQWGLTMQDDLTDATKWIIQQGVADKDRICIYGASYGGYAALMGAAKEPDLYKCAAGYVGVYDLNMMWGQGDIPDRVSGKLFLGETLGRNNLDQTSPSKLASSIKVPVFLAAGGADQRAPKEHTQAMERALKAAGVPVESLYYETEGHGFVLLKNQFEYYGKLLNFFSRHLGGRAPVLPPIEKKK